MINHKYQYKQYMISMIPCFNADYEIYSNIQKIAYFQK